MSDRVAVMSDGRIEQLDDPRTIYDQPKTAFVADFIGEMNFLEGDVTEAGGGQFTVDAGAGVSVRGRGDVTRGTRARVGIRSERMTARAGSPDPGANSAAAEVITKMYLGDQIQIVAQFANGTNVVVREQRKNADPALDTIDPGDHIAISWDEAAPLMLGTLAAAATASKEEAS
jgi:spermidine/putrescine transport system ATP-binding protein